MPSDQNNVESIRLAVWITSRMERVSGAVFEVQNLPGWIADTRAPLGALLSEPGVRIEVLGPDDPSPTLVHDYSRMKALGGGDDVD